MSQQSVLLQLPEALYERVQRAAQESNRPVETVLLDSLSLLFGDLPDTKTFTRQYLETLSGEQLWAIVYRPLIESVDKHLQELTGRSKEGNLSDDELAEMERLVGQVDDYIVLRSKALVLLKERGHDVERYLILNTQ